MFTVTLSSGVAFKVYFEKENDKRGRPRYTFCHLVDVTPGTLDPVHIVASSRCNYDAGARWDAKRGRKEALKKALIAYGLPREVRRDVVWPLYFKKSNEEFTKNEFGH